MFSYTFDSEVSCRVSVLVKKFDCSYNGVAAALSAIDLALPRQYKYIKTASREIHCEIAVDLAQLISYSRRQLPGYPQFIPCAKSMMLPNDRDPNPNGCAHSDILLL